MNRPLLALRAGNSVVYRVGLKFLDANVVDQSLVQVLDGRGIGKSGSNWNLGKDGRDRGAVDDKEPIREPSLAYAAG
jgi:hypothetical protein